MAFEGGVENGDGGQGRGGGGADGEASAFMLVGQEARHDDHRDAIGQAEDQHGREGATAARV